jgi:hypothetical protein
LEVSGQLHTTVALPEGKEPPVTTEEEAEWVPEQVMTLWSKEESNPGRSARNPVVIPTEINWILGGRVYRILL